MSNVKITAIILALCSEKVAEVLQTHRPWLAVKSSAVTPASFDALKAEIVSALPADDDDNTESEMAATLFAVASHNPSTGKFWSMGTLSEVTEGTDEFSIMEKAIVELTGSGAQIIKILATLDHFGSESATAADRSAIASAASMLLSDSNGLTFVKGHPLFTVARSTSRKAKESKPTFARRFNEYIAAALYARLFGDGAALLREAFDASRSAELAGENDAENPFSASILAELPPTADMTVEAIVETVSRQVGSRVAAVVDSDKSRRVDYVARKASGEAWRVDSDGNPKTGYFGLGLIYDGNRHEGKKAAKDAGGGGDLAPVDTDLPESK
jgi:hypothetical protein